MEQLLPLLYGELKAIAGRELRKERGPLTLQTTALVHECYMKFASAQRLTASDRVHFLAYSATVMRSIIVDLMVS